MIRSLVALAALTTASAASAAGAAELSPGDFAYGMPINTPGTAAAYRIAMPLELYRGVAHADLTDLRVFNAAGEVVPYELQQPRPTSGSHAAGPSLPLFALHQDSHAALDGVRVTIQSQGSAVNVQTGAAAEPDPHVISAYLADARALALPVSALQLHWLDTPTEFSGSLRVESSDDLASWRVERDGVPVLNLHAAGAQLLESRIELTATRAKFWRLTWIGKNAPFELTSVTAEPADQLRTELLTLTVPGSPLGGQRPEFSFDLGSRLPVTQVNLRLPEPNSAARFQLLSRARPADPWRPIAAAEFYRVQGSGTERSNAAFAIPTDSDRFWLARLEQSSSVIGEGEPALEVAWEPEEIVFLARGRGPYLLAYGNGTAETARTELTALLKGITVERATLGAPEALGGPERLRSAAPQFSWRSAVLWAVLGGGVLLLAWMAYRLSRELTGKADKS